jgi:hypothetical protein
MVLLSAIQNPSCGRDYSVRHGATRPLNLNRQERDTSPPPPKEGAGGEFSVEVTMARLMRRIRRFNRGRWN